MLCRPAHDSLWVGPLILCICSNGLIKICISSALRKLIVLCCLFSAPELHEVKRSSRSRCDEVFELVCLDNLTNVMSYTMKLIQGLLKCLNRLLALIIPVKAKVFSCQIMLKKRKSELMTRLCFIAGEGCGQ